MLNVGLLGVLHQEGGSTLEDPSHKWVINLSSKPLTQAKRSLLAKGPNYAIALRPPNLEYITAIESVCTKLSQQDVEELRANINRLLRLDSNTYKPMYPMGSSALKFYGLSSIHKLDTPSGL